MASNRRTPLPTHSDPSHWDERDPRTSSRERAPRSGDATVEEGAGSPDAALEAKANPAAMQTSLPPRPLAPGGGIAGASHVWSAPSPGAAQANGAGAGGGLQLPSKLAQQGTPTPTGSAPGQYSSFRNGCDLIVGTGVGTGEGRRVLTRSRTPRRHTSSRGASQVRQQAAITNVSTFTASAPARPRRVRPIRCADSLVPPRQRARSSRGQADGRRLAHGPRRSLGR